MPVNTPSKTYEEWIERWNRCRDVAEGEDKVKEGRTAYLPRLTGQEAGEYEAYLKRAVFYGATGRTIQGLAGMIMRKHPTISVPSSMESALQSIGPSGESILELITASVEEELTVGRIGALVDSHDDGTPYVCLYYAENIISWQTQVMNGVKRLSLIVIREVNDVYNAEDEFVKECEDVYRVLRLINGVYTVQIWKEREVKGADGQTYSEWYIDEEITPTLIGGATLDYIPFVLDESDPDDVTKPPLLDLVNLNLAHYRNSADYEHGLHFTALPTAWVAGFDVDKTVLKIGSSRAWVSKNPDAKAGFLEFSGQGLAAISNAMASKQTQMAILGARMLEEQKRQAETAEALKIRQGGDSSVLANISQGVGEMWTRVLKILAHWSRAADIESIDVQMNQDFNVGAIDSDTLRSLIEAVQSGNMSWSVFYHQMERGEVYPAGHTPEIERQLIELGFPVPEPLKIAPAIDDEDEEETEETDDEDEEEQDDE